MFRPEGNEEKVELKQKKKVLRKKENKVTKKIDSKRINGKTTVKTDSNKRHWWNRKPKTVNDRVNTVAKNIELEPVMPQKVAYSKVKEEKLRPSELEQLRRDVGRIRMIVTLITGSIIIGCAMALMGLTTYSRGELIFSGLLYIFNGIGEFSIITMFIMLLFIWRK